MQRGVNESQNVSGLKNDMSKNRMIKSSPAVITEKA